MLILGHGSLSFSICSLSICQSVSFSVYLSLSVSICVSTSHCLYLCLYVFLSLDALVSFCHSLRFLSIPKEYQLICSIFRKAWFWSLFFPNEAEVDVCKVNGGGCHHRCLNQGGRPVCECRSGYRLA